METEIDKAARFLDLKMKDKSLTISKLLKIMNDYEKENSLIIKDINNQLII